MTNSTITGNQAKNNGGGINERAPIADFEIVNSIVLGNNALVEGNEINFLGDAPAVTDQNIIESPTDAFITFNYRKRA